MPTTDAPNIDAVISELATIRTERDTIKEQLESANAERTKLEEQVKTLKESVAAHTDYRTTVRNAVKEIMGSDMMSGSAMPAGVPDAMDTEGPNDEVVKALGEIKVKVSSFATELIALIDSAISVEVNEMVKVQTPRPLIVEMVRAKRPKSRDEVKTIVAQVMSEPAMKSVIEQAVLVESGPKQSRPINTAGTDSDGWKRYFANPKS